LWQPDKTQNIVELLKNPQPEALLDLKEEDLSGAFYDRRNHALCWSCDGTRLLTQDNSLNVRIWLRSGGEAMQTMKMPDRSGVIPIGKKADVAVRMFLPRVIASPTDPALFATNDLDAIVVGDIRERKVQQLLQCGETQALKGMEIAHERYYPQPSALAWSPDGRYLAGAYISSPEIFIWDLQDPQPRKDKNGLQLPKLSFGKTGGHDNTVLTDLSWSPDGRYLASSAFDATAIIWQVDGASI
jgi:WD40 repeat protein